MSSEKLRTPEKPLQQEIHVAIVPDGNGRWATKHHREVWEGHLAGAQIIRQLPEWIQATEEEIKKRI